MVEELKVLSWGGRLSMHVIPEAEEWPIDSKRVESLLIICCEKTLLDLWKYFHGLKISFGSTYNGVKSGFRNQPKG